MSKNNKPTRKPQIGTLNQLQTILPLTDAQHAVYTAWGADKNLVLHGAAGTGKTFITLYLALREVLTNGSDYDGVYIIRSLVPTREVGFLPGTLEDKSAVYEIPYKHMIGDLFGVESDYTLDALYDEFKDNGTLDFVSTSYIRGITLNNCIILVDEFSNMNFHELDSVITRMGENCRIAFCGDITQSDLVKKEEKSGILDFMEILGRMTEFESIEFGIKDIVRSGIVKAYLTEKYKFEQEGLQT